LLRPSKKPILADCKNAKNPVIFFSLSGKILEEEEMAAMTQSLDLLIRCDTHPNIIQLIGLCEDKVSISSNFFQGTLAEREGSFRNNKGGSTVPLTSCLTGLDMSDLQIKTKMVSCHTAD
jgi:hypothetical protein